MLSLQCKKSIFYHSASVNFALSIVTRIVPVNMSVVHQEGITSMINSEFSRKDLTALELRLQGTGYDSISLHVKMSCSSRTLVFVNDKTRRLFGSRICLMMDAFPFF